MAQRRIRHIHRLLGNGSCEFLLDLLLYSWEPPFPMKLFILILCGLFEVEPDWRYKERLLLDSVQPVMVMDSLLSSHQISVPLDDPRDITQIFDNISYKKGG